MAEWLRALDSSSGVSDRQSVGSSPAHGRVEIEPDSLWKQFTSVVKKAITG